MSYNGYSNYETWNVCLWIDNDQGEQEYWAERAAEIAKEQRDEDEDDADSAKSAAISTLAEQMESFYEEQKPDIGGFFGDILQAALNSVDWREAAETRFDDDETFVAAVEPDDTDD